MSDVTESTEPHAEPRVIDPSDAPAQIPPEAVEAQVGGHTQDNGSVSGPYASAIAGRALPRRSGTLVLTAIGFLMLFLAVAWEYLRQDQLAKHVAAVARTQTQEPARVDAVEDALRAETATRTSLGQDVAALKDAPHPATADLGPLDARLKAVERTITRLAAASSAPSGAAASAPSDITARLDDLSRKVASLSSAAKPAVAPQVTPAPQQADLGPIEARVKALEDKPAPYPAPAPQPPAAPDSALLNRVNGMADRLELLGHKLAEAQSQAAAAQAAAEAAQARATAILARATAAASLDSGRPLGQLPHASPALARFAHDAPPTEASLRLSYDAAAQRAQDASVPPTAGKRFGARMLTQIESLVTVSQGDHVLVGPPAATILAGAHEKLQAGDLAGAVATLGGLDPSAHAAMAGWIDHAQALLDARAALQSDPLGAP